MKYFNSRFLHFLFELRGMFPGYSPGSVPRVSRDEHVDTLLVILYWEVRFTRLTEQREDQELLCG